MRAARVVTKKKISRLENVQLYISIYAEYVCQQRIQKNKENKDKKQTLCCCEASSQSSEGVFVWSCERTTPLPIGISPTVRGWRE